GPGTSALLKGGKLALRWQGGGTRMTIPADYLLPAVTTRGELGGLAFNGKTAVLAHARPGEGGRSRFLVASGGALEPLAFKGTVSFDAIAPDGRSIYLTRRAAGSDSTRYTVLVYSRLERTLNPVVTKVVFSSEGLEKA